MTMKTLAYSKLIELLADAGQELREAKDREGRYYQALSACAYRYEEMLVAAPANFELESFLDQFRRGIEARDPLNKLNRWLGYIQGRLIAQGLTDVDAERDWSRPLFRPLDYPE